MARTNSFIPLFHRLDNDHVELIVYNGGAQRRLLGHVGA